MNEIIPFSLTDDVLDIIEFSAENLLTIREIARLLMCDEDELRQQVANPYSPVHKRYYKGKTTTVLSIRKQEIKLALSGSPQAVDKALDFINDMNDDEIL